MKKLILLATVFILSKNSFSQKTDSVPCPKIVLEGPRQSEVIEGQEAIVNVKAFKKSIIGDSTISYKWVTDLGMITRGQNSKEVYINTRGLQDQAITAAVIISGLRPECPSFANITIRVVKDKPIRTETKIISSQGTPRF